MNKEERKKRVLARGEVSGHCHVITGNNVLIKEEKGTIFVEVGNEGAVLKHILEKEWIEEEKEIWTGEHKDISVKPGKYEYVPQVNFNPLTQRIEEVGD